MVHKKSSSDEKVQIIKTHPSDVGRDLDKASRAYKSYVKKYPDDMWRLGGHFGQALYEGRLDDAMCRADLVNQRRLKNIINSFV